MKFCLQPFFPYERGQQPGRDPISARKPLTPVACGRCKHCIINRKQDWAGRLCAESLASAETYFFTFTYANEPPEFPYEDVQGMLKRLRFHMAKKGVFVRHFVVGEFGEERGRRHWHALLFFSKPVGLEPTKPGELWYCWDHGWTSLERVNGYGSERMRRIRYCAKYAVTAIDDDGHPRPRMSLMPAIGVPYFLRMAQRMAKGGIVPDGKYTLPGCIWRGGPRQGYHETFTLRGAARAEFILEYCREWERLYPERDFPRSDWLRKYHPDSLPSASRLTPPVPLLDRKRSRVIDIETRMMVVRAMELGRLKGDKQVTPGQRYLVGLDWAAVLNVGRDGSAAVSLEPHVWIPIHTSISEVIDLPPEMVLDVDAWIRRSRGPMWSDEHGKTVRWSANEGLQPFKPAREKGGRFVGSDQPAEVVRLRHGQSLGSFARDAGIARAINGSSGAGHWVSIAPRDGGQAGESSECYSRDLPAFLPFFREIFAEVVKRDGQGGLGFDG